MNDTALSTTLAPPSNALSRSFQVNAHPAYATVPHWGAISGMGRSVIYEALGRGDLKAVKLGSRTLIDVEHGLAWIRSLPPAAIRPHGFNRQTTIAAAA